MTPKRREAATAQDNSFLDPRLSHQTVGNELLRRLSTDDYALIEPHLTRVPLELGSTISIAGDPIETICFPEAGVIGFVDRLPEGRRLAVGIVGRDGFIGWPLALTNDRWPHDALVRAESGTALRMDAARLLQAMRRSSTLRDLLLRYTSCLISQMSQTVISNLIHSVERRTARWILLYHDRIDGDDIPITHEELGVMLGVRRSSITDALHCLEGNGAIRGARGRIIVRNRIYLETLTSETYGFAEGEYRRLIKGYGPAITPH